MNNFPRYLGTHIKAHTIVVNSAREKKNVSFWFSIPEFINYEIVGTIV